MTDLTPIRMPLPVSHAPSPAPRPAADRPMTGVSHPTPPRSSESVPVGVDQARLATQLESGSIHVVQPGDTLGAIAARLGVDVQDLYERNRAVVGPDPNRIEPGMRLVIPGSPLDRLSSVAVTEVAGADAAPSIEPVAAPPTRAAGTGDRDALVQQLRDLLVRRGSPMADSVEALVDAALRHDVDPRLMVAIAGQESEFGTTNPASLANNPFGFLWNGDLNSPFESWEAGYERVAARLSEMIHEQGFTSVYLLGEGNPEVANDGYCEVGAANDPTGLNNHWVAGVSAMYAELGGDPGDVRIGATERAVQPTSGGGSTIAAEDAFVTQFVSSYNEEGPTGSADCGPASLLMALRLAGQVPAATAGADANGDGRISDQDAIRDMRFRMTGQWETGFTNSGQVRSALDAMGVSWEGIDGGGDAAWSRIVQAAQAGQPMVLSGHTSAIAYGTAWGDGYDANYGGGQSPYHGTGAQSVGHFVTITDYDPATDTFLVLDPMVSTGPLRVPAAEVRSFWEGGPSATVVTG